MDTLVICLSLGTLVGCIWLYLFKERLRLSLWLIPIISVLNTVAGLICVKLFAGIENWGNPLSSGQSLFGSIFILPLFYFVGAKLFGRKYSDVFDIFLLCTITTLVFARVDCILSGCCYGIYLPGSDTLRWPTREMEIVFHLVLIVVLLFIKKKTNCLDQHGRYI